MTSGSGGSQEKEWTGLTEGGDELRPQQTLALADAPRQVCVEEPKDRATLERSCRRVAWKWVSGRGVVGPSREEEH